MAKVGIVMGSDSDMPIMSKAADILEKLGIDYEMKIISAHREPDVFFEYAKTAEEKGFKVIIAGAGMAAHLPGMCAAIFPMPVIGIPMHTTSLGGAASHGQDLQRHPVQTGHQDVSGSRPLCTPAASASSRMVMYITLSRFLMT